MHRSWFSADADLDKAIEVSAAAKFRNAGQVCVAPTRFLIQDSVADEFIDGIVKYAEGLKIGNGLDADTGMGPLANERRIPAMEALIQDAVSHGAT